MDNLKTINDKILKASEIKKEYEKEFFELFKLLDEKEMVVLNYWLLIYRM